MAATGDIIEEFKHAKPPEKMVIVLGATAVVGIGAYLYLKNKAAGTSTAGVMPQTGSTGSSQVAGYPAVGANGTPVLPSGVNPLYDPNGNLIAFQNPSTTPTTTPTPGPAGPPGPAGTPSHPANWFTSVLGKIGYNAVIHPGGYDVNGQRFWVGNNNSNMFYAPIGTQINRGAQGRIWIQTPGSTSGQLLTGGGMTTSHTTVAKTAAKK